MNHTLFKTQDHPEANGRKALAGESEYPLTFTLDSGELLTVRLGQAGFDTVTNLLMDMISRAPSHDDGSLTITPYWKLKNQNGSLALRCQTLETELSRAQLTDLRAAPVATDTARLNKLDGFLTDDTGFQLIITWHNDQDVITIKDRLGNVWGDAMVPEDAEEQDATGATIRAAIDSIGRKPKRKVGATVDEQSIKSVIAVAEKWLAQFEETVEGLDPEESAAIKTDRAIIDSAKEEFLST